MVAAAMIIGICMVASDVKAAYRPSSWNRPLLRNARLPVLVESHHVMSNAAQRIMLPPVITLPPMKQSAHMPPTCRPYMPSSGIQQHISIISTGSYHAPAFTTAISHAAPAAALVVTSHTGAPAGSNMPIITNKLE